MPTLARNVSFTPVPYVDRAYRKWQQLHYPSYLWGAVGAFIALVSFQRLVCLVMAYRTKRSTRSGSDGPPDDGNEKGGAQSHGPPGSNRPLQPRALRHFPSAALSYAQLLFFRVRLPFYRLHRMNVAEMTVSLAYLAALLIWSFIHSRDLTVRYWANRTAHLAASQTPLIVALAGKNNIVTLLTGIGYEKLNVLHRAAARSTLILIWAHVFGRWKLGLWGRFSLDELDMQFGVVSMVAFTLATLLSFRPIRNMAREAFLVIHIVLVAMYLIFGLFHAPKVKYRFWPALAIWALDRLLRCMRLIVLNRLWMSIFPGKSRLEDATLERVSSDTVRLTVRRDFTWSSGQHAYILAPSIAKLSFESHPFTIASTCTKSADTKDSGYRELVFIIRGRDGFTKKLLEASETRRSIPVAIDGPYGAPPTLSHYSSCIFLAGGSGVSYTLPLLLGLVSQVRLGEAVAQRILFAWMIRDRSHFDWVSSLLYEVIEACPPTLQLNIDIYVTKQVLKLPIVDEAAEIESRPSITEKSVASSSGFHVVKFLSGRPNLALLFKEELSSAHGRVSVNVCGPSTLSDAVRDALTTCDAAKPSAVLRGVPRTTLHVETFGW